jgi:uroporphyrinogen-III decarboxylase
VSSWLEGVRYLSNLNKLKLSLEIISKSYKFVYSMIQIRRPQMLKINFDEHNREIKEMWNRFNSGNPYRIPIFFGMNPRFMLLDPNLNKNKISFKSYFENPDIMFNIQLEFFYWIKHNIIQDYELGIPEEGWTIYIDFQNVYEACWFGCAIRYFDDQVPDTIPILNNDNKSMLFDKGIPGPFDGFMELNLRYYEFFQSRAKSTTYFGKPIKECLPYAIGTDGPFTLASNLRGATEILMDFFDDPDYAHQLMNYITEAVIFRIKAWRKMMNLPIQSEQFGFADDSIQSISTEMYKEFVLPYHKKIVKELGGKGTHKIHLCGDAGRHFLTIRDELNVYEFDTGFPMDFGEMRKKLGPNVRLIGGPAIHILRNGTKEEVYEETKRILASGVLEGGNFILREGNNLAPLTPIENIESMYYCGREYGKINN